MGFFFCFALPQHPEEEAGCWEILSTATLASALGGTLRHTLLFALFFLTK